MITHLADAICQLPDIKSIALVTNAKFYPDFMAWSEQTRCSKPIRVISDGTRSNDERLGAIGDICLVVDGESIDDDLLIVGGDNLFRFDLGDFADFARRRGTSVAVYTLPQPERASLYGNVELDPEGRICWFEEKPAQPRTALIATCVYVIRRSDLSWLSRYRATGASMDAPGHFMRWLSGQTDVYGYVFDGVWFDVGDPASLEQANAAFASSEPSTT
jgi:glucose-1-phosphate thymidylyltransferase